LTSQDKFVQLQYHEEDDKKAEAYVVKPGLWSIIKTMAGLQLQETKFVNDKILESLVQTKDVTDKVECFFRNLHVYAEEGIEVAKRGILLFGQAGGGKTTIINKVANEYVKDGKTAVIVWTTDKFEAFQVKDFIKAFEYDGVEKLILIVEDIGGTEIESARMRSDASLLSLLDNQEKTFSIPVLILATTNYPENFMGNLTNRPQRFDDKIKVSPPNGEARGALLKFFGKGREDEESLILMASRKCEGFTPAHIKEVIIRSRIYEKSMIDVIKEMVKEVSAYSKGFSEQGSMGITND
jgi:SpoVK/Ycf46/Vps4 family AAA+-type ATPase